MLSLKKEQVRDQEFTINDGELNYFCEASDRDDKVTISNKEEDIPTQLSESTLFILDFTL